MTPFTRSTSAELALALADRLLDDETVLGAAPDTDPGSLARLSGTALLHARLACADDRFAAGAHRHWTLAARHARTGRAGLVPAGIITGPGALATSLILGTPYLPDPRRHLAARTRATRWLSQRACVVADDSTITSWSGYDAINGLAGIGRILLAAAELGHTDAHQGLTASLSALTAMITRSRPGKRPGWWVPADRHPRPTAVPPSGAATTGLAHGIAGPLAVLAVAHTAGYTTTGQSDAIRDAAEWLLRWQEPHPAHTWPPYVSGREIDRGAAEGVPGRRDAWCYGTPGISRALALAAQALDDQQLHAAARRAIDALVNRSPHRWDVDGPALCHGHAGIVASTTRSTLADSAAALVVAAFRSNRPPTSQHRDRGAGGADPGLLTGSAGIALAMADHGHIPAPEVTTRWNAALLLA